MKKLLFVISLIALAPSLKAMDFRGMSPDYVKTAVLPDLVNSIFGKWNLPLPQINYNPAENSLTIFVNLNHVNKNDLKFIKSLMSRQYPQFKTIYNHIRFVDQNGTSIADI